MDRQLSKAPSSGRRGNLVLDVALVVVLPTFLVAMFLIKARSMAEPDQARLIAYALGVAIALCALGCVVVDRRRSRRN